MHSFWEPAQPPQAMKAVQAPEKDWKNQPMNNANYEKAVEMMDADNWTSNETSESYERNVNCENDVSCANDVAPAWLTMKSRLISVSTWLKTLRSGSSESRHAVQPESSVLLPKELKRASKCWRLVISFWKC